MHKQFLLTALEAARQNRGFCSPNPAVGAVMVQDGRVIAQASHKGVGHAHAEQALIHSMANHDLSKITLYVTLGPCNHWGKTPPCVKAIIESGIKKVVFAAKDPNPIVACNDSSALLREQDIEVIHYPLEEIDAFYHSYRHWLKSKKPFVTAKLAISIDGKVAGINGTRIAISSIDANCFTHQKRLASDAILTTHATVSNDDPLLNVRLGSDVIAKPVIVLDRKLQLSSTAKIYSSAEKLIVFHDEKLVSDNKLKEIIGSDNGHKASATYIGCRCRDDQLDLNAVLLKLGEMGFHDIWVEAGSILFEQLHELGLVNQTYLYVAPKVIGEQATSMQLSPSFFESMKSISWQQMGKDAVASITWGKK